MPEPTATAGTARPHTDIPAFEIANRQAEVMHDDGLYQDTATRFARDTAGHEMRILHDDGLYRHVRFSPPDGSDYGYELITVPNCLVFRGPDESYAFRRERDMFAFFRSKAERPGWRINPGYWAEKLTSNRSGVKVYSEAKLNLLVAEDLRNAETHWPGVTKAWDAAAGDYINLEYEQTAREALRDFEFGAKNTATCPCGERIEVDADAFIPADWRERHPRGLGHPYTTDRIPGFRFHDTGEWDLEDFGWWYLWACFGIVEGIRRYDAAKALAAAKPSEPAVHYTRNGSAAACGARSGASGTLYTVSFDEDDPDITCPGCCLYLKGLKDGHRQRHA